jgi:hypothetical protein
MTVKAFFLPQGMIIGEVTESYSAYEPEKKEIKVKNPALVITRQTEVILAPFLQLVDEKEITLDLENVAFKQLFTPKNELANHYNQLYGSGLVVTNVLPL